MSHITKERCKPFIENSGSFWTCLEVYWHLKYQKPCDGQEKYPNHNCNHQELFKFYFVD